MSEIIVISAVVAEGFRGLAGTCWGLAGWREADPARTMFQYIGPRDDVEKLISGEQWLSLPEYDEQEVCRDDYAYDHEVEDE